MSFSRFASWCAYLAAATGLAYSITFVATTDDDTRFGEGLEGAFLLAGGVLALVVFGALYELVREREAGFALLGLLLGILWIGRLVGGDADDVALLLPAALAGLVAHPVWYVLVGRELAATSR